LPQAGCDLQQDTVEEIDASASSLAMRLLIPENPEQSRFALMFSAQTGDRINRPTPEIVALGYTTVDRQVAGYNSDESEFRFSEYLYDRTVSDSEGLAHGFYKSLILKREPDGGISYTKTYSDGEVYRCELAPAQ
jgi:hypothetical protein